MYGLLKQPVLSLLEEWGWGWVPRRGKARSRRRRREKRGEVINTVLGFDPYCKTRAGRWVKGVYFPLIGIYTKLDSLLDLYYQMHQLPEMHKRTQLKNIF